MNEAELSAQEVLLIKKARAGGKLLFLWWGTILSVQTGPPHSVTITIGGSSQPVPGVIYDASYTPVANDVVWLLQTEDDDWFVGGKRA